MLKDFRYAVRLLARSKGWTAMGVLSLALGIGANTVRFSAVNPPALRAVPADDPGSLVRFRHAPRTPERRTPNRTSRILAEKRAGVGSGFDILHAIARGTRTWNPEPGTARVEPNVDTNRELSTEKCELQCSVHA